MSVLRRSRADVRVCSMFVFLKEISLKKLFLSSSSHRCGHTSSNLFKDSSLSKHNLKTLHLLQPPPPPSLADTSTSSAPHVHRRPPAASLTVDHCRLDRRPPPPPSTPAASTSSVALHLDRRPSCVCWVELRWVKEMMIAFVILKNAHLFLGLHRWILYV
ncbi:hypothetical protein Hanom_Chr08g00685141 [Helianthus anomalus]